MNLFIQKPHKYVEWVTFLHRHVGRTPPHQGRMAGTCPSRLQFQHVRDSSESREDKPMKTRARDCRAL